MPIPFSSFPGMSSRDIVEALTWRELAVDSHIVEAWVIQDDKLSVSSIQSTTGFRARDLSSRFRARYADAMGDEVDWVE